MSAQNDCLAKVAKVINTNTNTNTNTNNLLAFQLVLKFYSKNNKNQNNKLDLRLIMLLRQVCSTFNKLVLNYISTLNICCYFDHNCSETLRKSIRMMPNLTCLNLTLFDNSNRYGIYDDYGDYGDYYIIVTEPNLALFFQSILSDLQRLNLTSLGIRYDSSGDVNASLLAPSLAELTTLTSLSLETPLAHQLVPSLTRLTNLTSLKFEFNNNETPNTPLLESFLAKIVPSLAQNLCSLPNLLNLDLGCSRLEDSDIVLLAHSLDYQPNLISINLEHNHITNAGLKLLAPSIGKMANLSSVKLRSNKISFSDSESFLSSLGKLTKLTELDLGYNFINGYGVSVLLPILTILTDLTFLDLESCYIRSIDTIRDSLEQSFAKLTNLKCLSLSNNNNEAIVPIIVNLTNLTNLNLSKNRLGPDEISLLAPSLMRMTSMTSLNLNCNQIEGLAGAQSLIPILRGMKHLKFLKIDGYNLRTEGKALLVDIFRTMPELRYQF
jgi:Ran GTPase-activating protein (RanGAP) involved in mRNA processing and transport